MGYVTSAIEHIGLTKLGNRLNLWPSSFTKWKKANRLPKSELAGLTDYARIMEEMSEGEYTAEKLIEVTREGWERKFAREAKQQKRARA